MRPYSPAKRPKVPEGLRIYAIGDVHGCADLLDQVLSRIDAHQSAHPAFRPVEIFLGDYIDRGPASREVLDRLIARSRERETVCLKGNHETFVKGFLNNPAILSEWRHYGGLETLLSYGLVPSVNMDPAEQARLATTFSRCFALKSSLIPRRSETIIHLWRLLFRPRWGATRHSACRAAREGPVMDTRGFSSL